MKMKTWRENTGSHADRVTNFAVSIPWNALEGKVSGWLTISEISKLSWYSVTRSWSSVSSSTFALCRVNMSFERHKLSCPIGLLRPSDSVRHGTSSAFSSLLSNLERYLHLFLSHVPWLNPAFLQLVDKGWALQSPNFIVLSDVLFRSTGSLGSLTLVLDVPEQRLSVSLFRSHFPIK